MLGAALAYYTVFSLAPLVVLAIANCRVRPRSHEAVQAQMFDQVRVG